MPDQLEKTIWFNIQKYIKSTIVLDCWKTCSYLQVGFEHNMVNHIYKFVNPDTKTYI